MRRRRLLRIAGTAAAAALAGCDDPAGGWHARDVAGTLPSLSFTMTNVTDGRTATAADFRGDVVLLTFGYTFCPDICPTTLANLSGVLDGLGPLAGQARVLFVTVDPGRDTLAGLRQYTASFAPQIVGLRGTPDQLATMARRYRVAYSVQPAVDGHPYEVTHSSLVYVFDRRGAARLLITSMATSAPDIAGNTADLRRLINEARPATLWERLADLA
jgi:protein SCO1